jgi:GrpB-like predicted nucleotidyltransferase (UPF0157 family)
LIGPKSAFGCRPLKLTELAARDWKYMQQYADAKTAVVKEIVARAEAAAP